jgi:hypothetical protein
MRAMERVITTTAAMVLEQDFILQIRRLQKQAEPTWVFNIMFSQMTNVTGKPDLLESAHDKLHDFAVGIGGTIHAMTNDDVFVVLPARIIADPTTYGAAIITAILPQGFDPGRSPVALCHAYGMPADYMPLRERVNYYLDVAKEIDANTADDPARALQADHVQGPLSAYALAQIERLLDDLDVRAYARAQQICERMPDGTWRRYYAENFISTADLQKEKFPRLELRASGRLFAELGAMLDRRMLANLLRTNDEWQKQSIGINLASKTVLSSTFAQFCHVVNGSARGRVTFEIHISDLFHDLATFENAISVLQKEGFRVVIDGVQAAMLPILRLEAVPADGYKISAGANGLPFLNEADVLQAARALPADKIIFMHVESAAALDVGASLGVTKYQGFYIDQHIAPTAV